MWIKVFECVDSHNIGTVGPFDEVVALSGIAARNHNVRPRNWLFIVVVALLRNHAFVTENSDQFFQIRKIGIPAYENWHIRLLNRVLACGRTATQTLASVESLLR